LAEALFRYHAEQRGLGDHFEVGSAGTSRYHVGESPDPGSQNVARERLDLDISGQRAEQLSESHLREFDDLIAMSDSNIGDAQRLSGADSVDFQLLRDWEPDDADRGSDVPDPYGGGSSQFDHVFDIVDRCTKRLLDDLVERHDIA
jgi:protein-tyrosine phosphatase